MDGLNTYVYNQEMSDYCTRMASAILTGNSKFKDMNLASFYANASKGFKLRAEKVTFLECALDAVYN